MLYSGFSSNLLLCKVNKHAPRRKVVIRRMYRERFIFLRINKQIQDPMRLRIKKKSHKLKGMITEEARKIPAASERDRRRKGNSIAGIKENFYLNDYDNRDNQGEGGT